MSDLQSAQEQFLQVLAASSAPASASASPSRPLPASSQPPSSSSQSSSKIKVVGKSLRFKSEEEASHVLEPGVRLSRLESKSSVGVSSVSGSAAQSPDPDSVPGARSAEDDDDSSSSSRSLYTEDPDNNAAATTCTSDGSGNANNDNYCCTNCVGLRLCKMLNDKLIEDKYGKLQTQGKDADNSCRNFEQRAMNLDVFGPGKTFRDSHECRVAVYDYTCLWWGSQNEAYKNNCKDLQMVLTNGKKVQAALQPCLSFCTQVAMMCANRPDWIQLCGPDAKSGATNKKLGVLCDAKHDQECTAGPNEVSGVNCPLFEVHSFFSKGERTTGGGGGKSVLAGIAASAILLLW